MTLSQSAENTGVTNEMKILEVREKNRVLVLCPNGDVTVIASYSTISGSYFLDPDLSQNWFLNSKGLFVGDGRFLRKK